MKGTPSHRGCKSGVLTCGRSAATCDYCSPFAGCTVSSPCLARCSGTSSGGRSMMLRALRRQSTAPHRVLQAAPISPAPPRMPLRQRSSAGGRRLVPSKSILLLQVDIVSERSIIALLLQVDSVIERSIITPCWPASSASSALCSVIDVTVLVCRKQWMASLSETRSWQRQAAEEQPQRKTSAEIRMEQAAAWAAEKAEAKLNKVTCWPKIT